MIYRILAAVAKGYLLVLVSVSLVVACNGTVASASSPQATITHVIPNIGSNSIPVPIDIFGTDFRVNERPFLRTVDPNNNPIFVELLNVALLDETHMRAWVPANLVPAVYDLFLQDEMGELTAVLEQAYTVVASDEADDLFIHDYEFGVLPAAGPQVGQPAKLTVRVHRLGGVERFAEVEVGFYEGENLTNPVTEGNFLGTAVIPILEPNGTAVVSLETAFKEIGSHQIHAVVDPQNIIPELTKQNNRASRPLVVRPEGDPLTPRPPIVTINNGEQLTREQEIMVDLAFEPDTTTHSAPRSLLYVEYVFVQSASSWVPINRSDWLPLPSNAQNFRWELSDHPGIHYLLVWTADKNGNISETAGRQFINYAPEASDLLTDEGHLYRWPLQIGQGLRVRVTPLSGDPDLYVWNPDGSLAATSQSFDQVDEVTIVATQNGLHQIEVDGAAAGSYQLEIVPLGREHGNRAVGRPKGRPQPYFAPDQDPDGSTPLPPAPAHFLNLPLLRKEA